MRLYLEAISKNHIGYTPSMFKVENNNKNYIYLIEGEADYDLDGLNCRVKGQLLKNIRNKYISVSDQQKKELINLLNNKNTKVTIGIYPVNETGDDWTDEEVKLIYSDELSECLGSIDIWLENQEEPVEIDFDFIPEFNGL